MSTPGARVAVQLMPREKEDAFAHALKAAGKKSNLRIDNVRCNKDLSMVMDQCKRRWADVLGAMGGYQLDIYMEGRTDPLGDMGVKIEELCSRAGLDTNGANSKLSLCYTVTPRAPNSPAQLPFADVTQQQPAIAPKSTPALHDSALESLRLPHADQTAGRLVDEGDASALARSGESKRDTADAWVPEEVQTAVQELQSTNEPDAKAATHAAEAEAQAAAQEHAAGEAQARAAAAEAAEAPAAAARRAGGSRRQMSGFVAINQEIKRAKEKEGTHVYVLQWELSTEIDGFGDTSSIINSTGDEDEAEEDEAEAIIKANIERTENGLGSTAYMSWAAAKEARDAQFFLLAGQARHYARQMLGKNYSNLSTAEYEGLVQTGIVEEEDMDDRPTPEPVLKEDGVVGRVSFVLLWRPQPDRPRNRNDYVAACERIITVGWCWLREFALDERRGVHRVNVPGPKTAKGQA